jgi:prolyl-tRNA synthetase
MYWSTYFIPTLKENPIGTEAVSHKLLLRAGLVHMLTSGVYSYLPLGLKVLRNIENIIREEMDVISARELFLPCLHPMDLWKKTGRDETLKEVMIKFKDGKGREMCLGATHEEIITNLVKDFIQSYKQLPVTLYQIQTKFRDELRTRFGIVRACEFIMKDAYSFDSSQEGLQKNYDLMYEAYKKIFTRCGLEFVIKEADSGAMGGSVSHEFLVPAQIGEDKVEVQRDGKTIEQPALELGHIFQLGTKYSDSLKALFLDENGRHQPIIMGCYGIGVSRVIAAIIETNHDEKGIIWPKEITPFDLEIIPLLKKKTDDTFTTSEGIYKKLKENNFDILLDDRLESPGRKFNDADLIGIPIQIIIGQKNLKNNQVEIKIRKTGETSLVGIEEVVEKIKELL